MKVENQTLLFFGFGALAVEVDFCSSSSFSDYLILSSDGLIIFVA